MKGKAYKLIVAGFSMMFIGWLIVFFMVLNLVPVGFILSFLAYGMATIGLFIGFLGIFDVWKKKKKNHDQ